MNLNFNFNFDLLFHIGLTSKITFLETSPPPPPRHPPYLTLVFNCIDSFAYGINKVCKYVH